MTVRKDSPLIGIIKADKELERLTRTNYIAMANLFESDIRENLGLDAWDLEDKYAEQDIDYVVWLEFLNHPKIRKYIEDTMNTVILQRARKDMLRGENVSSSVALQSMAEDKLNISNSQANLIVVRLPERKKWNSGD